MSRNNSGRSSQVRRLIARLLATALISVNSTAARAASAETSPLKLGLSVTQVVVHAGSEVKVDILITNVSNHDIAFLRNPGARGELEAEIEVTDEYGNPVQMTKYWESLKKHGLDKFEGSRISTELKPGESFKTSAILNKLYDLSRSGTYTIYANKRIPDHLGGGVVKSNTLSITVAPD